MKLKEQYYESPYVPYVNYEFSINLANLWIKIKM